MENRFALPQTPFKTTDEEIAHLKKVIEEKEKALSDLNIKKDDLAVARETLALYKSSSAQDVLHNEFQIDTHEVEKIVIELSPEPHDKQISELVLLAREKGVKNALTVVEKMNNYHITDDFHRYVAEYLKEGFTLPGFKLTERLGKSLNMSLFEILIPEEAKSDSPKSLKEALSSMEQFYAGLLSISTNKEELWMALEIANANYSEEIVFYAAVPESRKSMFEKHILAVFPNAKIREEREDYNIFNETGHTVGVYATSVRNPIFPIRTYDNFDHDPLNAILSSFSKVDREGEGAAIQLIWSPVGDTYIKRYEEALKRINKGTPLKEAIDLPETIVADFAKSIKSIFKSSGKKKDGEEPKREQVDPQAIELIRQKISAPIAKCNIRILASSHTKESAEEILENIKSSFNQFDNTTGNAFAWKRAEKSDLRRLTKDFAFRMFDQDNFIPLNIREVATFLHFHTVALDSNDMLRQTRAATAAAPHEMPQSGVLLGINRHRNMETKAYLSTEDRLRHFYTIGQTGTGKSTLLKNMIVQDIKNGNGLCMIDPHGSDIQNVLANVPPERYDDVVYFDPAYTARPMGLNMLEYDENLPEQKTFVVNELFSIFKKLYGAIPESMGPAFEQYFRNSALLVMEDPASGNTLVDVSRVLSDKKYRDYKLERCKNPLVKQFWINAEKTSGEQGLANYVQYVTNKFDVFLANEIMRPVVAQEKSAFDFRELMDNKKILLVNLSKGRLGDINANLIGLILVGKILMAALSRVDSFGKDLPAFYLYIDEFQNITTDSITTILSEARKYKLSLNIAHQFIAQLEEGIKDAVFGNVGTMCAFRVGAQDAEALEPHFAQSFSSQDLMNIDNRNAYLRLLVNGKPAKPFNIEIPAPDVVDPSKVESIKELSYQKYGKDRAEVEAHIMNKYQL